MADIEEEGPLSQHDKWAERTRRDSMRTVPKGKDITVLVTNDDGIRAQGLMTLAEALRTIWRVVVVAPEQEQSASSHAVTLHKPLRINEYKADLIGVSGTPTDCVLLAVKRILAKEPDLIVSGINHGPNMGEDVNYSGTVAAAIEGSILGIPSIAISIVSWEPRNFDAAADASRYLAEKMLTQRVPRSTIWNVNIPDLPKHEIKDIRITKLGSRVYKDVIIEKKDPRGRNYFWIGGEGPGWNKEENTDFAAVSEGHISVTPLQIDITDYKSIVELNKWKLEWKQK
jgi:5'-nucleotidase